MTTTNLNSFLQQLNTFGILNFGQFTLASGNKSQFYLDLRLIPSFPTFFEDTMKNLSEMASNLQFDYIVGIPLAGVSFATMVSYFVKKPLLLLRKEQKKHGLSKMVEGKFEKGNTVLLIDDLITGGTSKEQALIDLRNEGLKVTDLMVIIDRRNKPESENKLWEIKNNLTVHALYRIKNQDLESFEKSID